MNFDVTGYNAKEIEAVIRQIAQIAPAPLSVVYNDIGLEQVGERTGLRFV